MTDKYLEPRTTDRWKILDQYPWENIQFRFSYDVNFKSTWWSVVRLSENARIIVEGTIPTVSGSFGEPGLPTSIIF